MSHDCTLYMSPCVCGGGLAVSFSPDWYRFVVKEQQKASEFCVVNFALLLNLKVITCNRKACPNEILKTLKTQIYTPRQRSTVKHGCRIPQSLGSTVSLRVKGSYKTKEHYCIYSCIGRSQFFSHCTSEIKVKASKVWVTIRS